MTQIDVMFLLKILLDGSMLFLKERNIELATRISENKDLSPRCLCSNCSKKTAEV